MKSKTQFSFVCILLFIVFIKLTSCKKDNVNASQAKAVLVTNIVTDSTSDSSLKVGLVAWYPFNGDTKDHSGHHNDVVFNNAVPAVGKNGVTNTAYQFNGVDNYMMVNNSNSLNPSKITLYAVIKIKEFYQGTCHGNRIINKEISDQDNGRYALGYDDAPYYNYEGCFEPVTKFQNLYGVYGDGGSTATGATDTSEYLKVNIWYNLAYVYNGTESKLYVNGKLVSTAHVKSNFTANTQPLLFGQTGNGQYPYWFNGKIDEIRIYNRALNASEVAALNTKN